MVTELMFGRVNDCNWTENKHTMLCCFNLFSAPGGSVVIDADKTKVSRSEVCVFAAEESLESIKAIATVSISLSMI